MRLFWLGEVLLNHGNVRQKAGVGELYGLLGTVGNTGLAFDADAVEMGYALYFCDASHGAHINALATVYAERGVALGADFEYVGWGTLLLQRCVVVLRKRLSGNGYRLAVGSFDFECDLVRELLYLGVVITVGTSGGKGFGKGVTGDDGGGCERQSSTLPHERHQLGKGVVVVAVAEGGNGNAACAVDIAQNLGHMAEGFVGYAPGIGGRGPDEEVLFGDEGSSGPVGWSCVGMVLHRNLQMERKGFGKCVGYTAGGSCGTEIARQDAFDGDATVVHGCKCTTIFSVVCNLSLFVLNVNNVFYWCNNLAMGLDDRFRFFFSSDHILASHLPRHHHFRPEKPHPIVRFVQCVKININNCKKMSIFAF